MATEEPTTPTGPNPQEAMLFFNIFKNVKGQPDIDWDQVAKDSGLKNGATAKKRFYQIKVKHGLEVKTPRKPRASGSQEELADELHTPVKDEDSEKSTPAKLSAKSSVKSTPAKSSAKSTPAKTTKRRKTSATTSVKTESDEVTKEVADSFDSVANSAEPAESFESSGPAGPESPDILAAPETPVRTTSFVAINSPPVTPSKAKSKGRIPLPTGKVGQSTSLLANELSQDAQAAPKEEDTDEDTVKHIFNETSVCALIDATLEGHEGV